MIKFVGVLSLLVVLSLVFTAVSCAPQETPTLQYTLKFAFEHPATGPEGKIVAYQVNAFEYLRPVADEGGTSKRSGDSAILYPVGFPHSEREVAGGRVHFSSPKIFGVDTLWGRSYDGLRRVIPGHDEGIGHPDQGIVHVGFPSSVACGLGSEFPGGQKIIHVPP